MRLFNIGQTCPLKNKNLNKFRVRVYYVFDIKWPCDCVELIRLSDT